MDGIPVGQMFYQDISAHGYSHIPLSRWTGIVVSHHSYVVHKVFPILVNVKERVIGSVCARQVPFEIL